MGPSCSLNTFAYCFGSKLRSVISSSVSNYTCKALCYSCTKKSCKWLRVDRKSFAAERSSFICRIRKSKCETISQLWRRQGKVSSWRIRGSGQQEHIRRILGHRIICLCTSAEVESPILPQFDGQMYKASLTTSFSYRISISNSIIF